MILSYVRRALGEEAVARVLAATGKQRAVSELAGPGTWAAREDILAVAEAAATVCGDPEIGRRSGEEMMRVAHERGTVDFVRGTGSIAAALEFACNMGTKMSAGRVFELAEVGESHAVLVATYLDPSYPDPFFCGQAAGYYGLVPDLFGYSGIITEPECMCRGDQRCVYRLSWSSSADNQDRAQAAEVEASRNRADNFAGRFEQLHLMATELARAEQVDTLLARITELAGYAIDAPRYLLAVRDASGSQLQIHHRGFEEDRAARSEERLLAGQFEQNERCLIADVASSAGYYGRLAAWYPKGSAATDMDGRLLGAYARHAAAALEAVASLESARHDRDTAGALLSLADALAEVGSRVDVARRLAAAVPAVADCQTVGVWLWEPT